LALALFAVPAILIGLLAMHVLTNDGMTETVSQATSAHTAAAPAHSPGEGAAASMGTRTPVPAEDCEAVCMPSHDMLGMICVLALLVTLVLFALRLILIRWEELRQALLGLAARAVALAPPTPPSLHVLSISRT